MYLYEGKIYNDDRIFILDLVLTERHCRTLWAVVTRRNYERFPPIRVDKFRSKEEAIVYIKQIEPTTPLISLGGKSPEQPFSYEDYCKRLNEKNIPSAIEIYELNKEVKREIIIDELMDGDGTIELRKSNRNSLINVLSWFHETIWKPGAA